MKTRKEWLAEAKHYDDLAAEAKIKEKPMPPQYYEQRSNRARDLAELARHNGIRKKPKT